MNWMKPKEDCIAGVLEIGDNRHRSVRLELEWCQCPNDDRCNEVFIAHTQALNGRMNMNDWRWTVNMIIRVKDSYSHVNPWMTVNDWRPWTVFERWLTIRDLNGGMNGRIIRVKDF